MSSKKWVFCLFFSFDTNIYWLVDGLMDLGYKVHLANPSAIKQYEGLKHTGDDWHSFWFVHMRRLNILPEGYTHIQEKDFRHDLGVVEIWYSKTDEPRFVPFLAVDLELARSLGRALRADCTFSGM